MVPGMVGSPRRAPPQRPRADSERAACPQRSYRHHRPLSRRQDSWYHQLASVCSPGSPSMRSEACDALTPVLHPRPQASHHASFTLLPNESQPGRFRSKTRSAAGVQYEIHASISLAKSRLGRPRGLQRRSSGRATRARGETRTITKARDAGMRLDTNDDEAARQHGRGAEAAGGGITRASALGDAAAETPPSLLCATRSLEVGR